MKTRRKEGLEIQLSDRAWGPHMQPQFKAQEEGRGHTEQQLREKPQSIRRYSSTVRAKHGATGSCALLNESISKTQHRHTIA